MVGGGIVKGGGTPMSFALVFKFPSPTVHKIPKKGGTFWGGKISILFCFIFWILKMVGSCFSPNFESKNGATSTIS